MTERAVLSVDFELFGQTPAYRTADGVTEQEDAGIEAVEFLLESFDAVDASGTFFTVSSLAESHGDLIEAIGARGHEIGSHTRSHFLLSDLSEAERRSELLESREQLESVSGTDVNGFRAPAFDVPPGHYEMLAETGYTYDSSIVSSRRIPGWYGGEFDADRPCSASAIRSGAPETISELPVSVMPGLRLPLTGTWLRFFGRRYTLYGMRWLAKRGITPVLYIHPWELADLPRVDGVPSRVYWRTGEWMRRTVEILLQEPFEFVTAKQAVARAP